MIFGLDDLGAQCAQLLYLLIGDLLAVITAILAIVDEPS